MKMKNEQESQINDGENIVSIDNKPDGVFESFKQAYESFPPEKQVIFGVFASYVYLTMLISPEILPQRVQPLIELFNKIPLSNLSLWTTTSLALIGSVDGVRRIIMDRLPLYHAYLRVFVFKKIENEE